MDWVMGGAVGNGGAGCCGWRGSARVMGGAVWVRGVAAGAIKCGCNLTIHGATQHEVNWIHPTNLPQTVQLEWWAGGAAWVAACNLVQFGWLAACLAKVHLTSRPPHPRWVYHILVNISIKQYD